MKQITSRGRKILLPECIDELNPEQYKYYLFVSSALASELISLHYFRIRWFSFLMGLGNADYLILKPEHIRELTPEVEPLVSGFLYSDGRPILSTTRNLLPVYNGHSGPGDWLSGMTFGQVIQCATELQMATEDSSPQAFEQIARVMYGYPDTDTADPVDPILVHHAVTLFSSVWSAITSGPIEINGRKIDFSIIFKKSSSASRAPDDNTGWAGITFEIASAGLFGTVAQVEAADFWDILLYLYRCKFEHIHSKK